MSSLAKLLTDLFQSNEFCLDLSQLQFLQELEHLKIQMLSTEPVPLAEFLEWIEWLSEVGAYGSRFG